MGISSEQPTVMNLNNERVGTAMPLLRIPQDMDES